MAQVDVVGPSTLLRRLTIPIGVLVAVVVALAWYVTWATFGTMMMLTAPAAIGSTDLAVFFALILVMMVAMMLPSALPMALAYHGITRLEGGQRTKPADVLGTLAFVVPYFVVWGVFGVSALLALAGLGVMGSMLIGPALFLPAGVLVAAGLWQITRTKEVCLAHCTTPMGFVLHHWRSGRLGAMRMGFRHSFYCIGCCWLFMLVLFVAGSMSLVWMGGLSIAIFVEKVGVRSRLVSRAIGVVLVALGAALAYATIVAM